MKCIACISSDGLLVPAAETPREDKQRFAALTASGTCWVGRKTYQELPERMRLGSCGRKYRVLSRDQHAAASCIEEAEYADFYYQIPAIADYEGEWVIGGNEVYSAWAPHVTLLYLSILYTAGGVGLFPITGDRIRFEAWDILCHQKHTSHEFLIYRKNPGRR